MMTQEPETKQVDKFRFACDGGGGTMGHPRVWLQIPQPQNWIECPYCDCKYIYSPGPHQS